MKVLQINIHLDFQGYPTSDEPHDFLKFLLQFHNVLEQCVCGVSLKLLDGDGL